MNTTMRKLKKVRNFGIIIMPTILLLCAFFLVIAYSVGEVNDNRVHAYSYTQTYYSDNKGLMSNKLDHEKDKTYTQSPYPSNTDLNKVILTMRLDEFYEIELFVFGEDNVSTSKTEGAKYNSAHAPNRTIEVNTTAPFYWVVKFSPLQSYDTKNTTYGVVSQSIVEGSIVFKFNGQPIDLSSSITVENGLPLSNLAYLNGLLTEDYSEVRNESALDGLFTSAGTYEIAVTYESKCRSQLAEIDITLETQPAYSTVYKIVKQEQPVKNILLPDTTENTPMLFYSLYLDGCDRQETFLNANSPFVIEKEQTQNNLAFKVFQNAFEVEVKNNIRQELYICNPLDSTAALSYKSTGGGYINIYTLGGFISPQPGSMIIDSAGNRFFKPISDKTNTLFNGVDCNNFGTYKVELSYQLQYINPDSRLTLGAVINCKDTYTFEYKNDGWYSINYELNEGNWVSGYVAPDWYDSRSDEIIKLPQGQPNSQNKFDIKKAKTTTSEWQFVGWFYDYKFRSENASNLGLNLDLKENIYLYAKWTELYTVTLNHQSGNSACATVKAPFNFALRQDYENSQPQPAIPTRIGYTFGGYYDQPSPTTNETKGIQYFDSQMRPVKTWDKKSGGTLYAKWTANNYTVTFDANGGILGTNSVSATFDSSMPNASKSSRDGYYFLGYFDTMSTTGGTQYYTENMGSVRTWNKDSDATLYARWQQTSVTLNKNGGTNGTNSISVCYGASMPSATVPTNSKTGNQTAFLGYFDAPTGGTKYYNPNMTSAKVWDKKDNSVTLYAQWQFTPNTYTIKYVDATTYSPSYSGAVATDQTFTYGVAKELQSGANVTGYTFYGWDIDDNGDNLIAYTPNQKITINEDEAHLKGYVNQNGAVITLYAKWTANQISASVNPTSVGGKNNAGAQTLTITASGGSGSYKITSASVLSGNTRINIDTTNAFSSTKQFTMDSPWDSGDNESSGSVRIYIIDTVNQTTTSVVVSFQWSKDSCVAEGTLITLADGSLKAVEDLNGSEMLLVWDVYSGQFSVAPIMLINAHDAFEQEIINLTFSDGTIVRVIDVHGFWDYTLNKYVYLNKDASAYIGHWFSKQTADQEGQLTLQSVQLINVSITYEIVAAYSPITLGALCYYVNGMLSISGADVGWIPQIFEINQETMMVDEAKMAEDIDAYGLFEYSELSEYFTPELFEIFNVKYLKVAIGKGIITFDEVMSILGSLNNKVQG